MMRILKISGRICSFGRRNETAPEYQWWEQKWEVRIRASLIFCEWKLCGCKRTRRGASGAYEYTLKQIDSINKKYAELLVNAESYGRKIRLSWKSRAGKPGKQ